MDTRTLEAFLLATAQESWGQWYSDTRWMLADFLEEGGTAETYDRLAALANELRAMEVVIADEIDTSSAVVAQSYLKVVSAASVRRPDLYVVYLEGWAPVTGESKWMLLDSFTESTGRSHLQTAYRYSRMRVRMHTADSLELRYALHTERGQWRGTLSLERACHRLRHRVLRWFPDWCENWNARPDKTIDKGFAEFLIRGDDSPRWVLYEPSIILNDEKDY